MDEMANDHRRLLRFIAKQDGWTVEELRGGHIRITAPGGDVIITGKTPSEYRAQKNFIARLRRAGLRYDPKGESR